MLLDSHGAAVSNPVKVLLQQLHELHPIEALLLERESNVPSLDDVVAEAADLWSSLGHAPHVRFRGSSMNPFADQTL